MGVRVRDYVDWSWETGRAAESVAKRARNVLTGTRIVVDEWNEAIAGYAALLKTNDILQGKGSFFDRQRLGMLGFTEDEVEIIMGGSEIMEAGLGKERATELKNAVVARMTQWATNTTALPSELSEAGTSRLWPQIFMFDRYAQFTMNRSAVMVKGAVDAAREHGTNSKEFAAAAGLMAAFLGGTAPAAGLLSMLMVAFFTGGLPALRRKLDDATTIEGANELFWDSFLYTIAGGLGDALVRTVEETDASMVLESVQPIRITQTFIHFATGTGLYQDLDWWDSWWKMTNTNVPLSKSLMPLASAMGISDFDVRKADSINRYWKWRDKNQGDVRGSSLLGTGGNDRVLDREFRVQMKKFGKRAREGAGMIELSEILRNAYGGIDEGLTDKEMREKMADSIEARKLLPKITPRLRPQFVEDIGEDVLEDLRMHDAVLGRWAESVRG